MKVCILSDSHDNSALMLAAVEEAADRGVEAVLHCGDVVAPNTLGKLGRVGLPVHVIHGNNAGDLYAMARLVHESGGWLHYYGQDADFTLAGRRIFLVHYPHYAKAMACTGEYDLVCCGHDHRPKIMQVPNIKGGSTPLVDPGTVGGIGHKPTWVLGDLASMTFTLCELMPLGQ
jgi:hypothetical protein